MTPAGREFLLTLVCCLGLALIVIALIGIYRALIDLFIVPPEESQEPSHVLVLKGTTPLVDWWEECPELRDA